MLVLLQEILDFKFMFKFDVKNFCISSKFYIDVDSVATVKNFIDCMKIIRINSSTETLLMFIDFSLNRI